MLNRIPLALFSWGLLSAIDTYAQPPKYFPAEDARTEILANTNRKPAGRMHNRVLSISLEAREGLWYPETKDGPGLSVQAFAEKGRPLSIPGPLIRVIEGTEIRASIHNAISASTLVMHGFHPRPGDPKDTFEIPSGETREVRFKAGAAGTYYY